jgi:hypothetical protein
MCVCVCVCVCVHQEVKMPRWAAMLRYWQKFSKVIFLYTCIQHVYIHICIHVTFDVFAYPLCEVTTENTRENTFYVERTHSIYRHQPCEVNAENTFETLCLG